MCAKVGITRGELPVGKHGKTSGSRILLAVGNLKIDCLDGRFFLLQRGFYHFAGVAAGAGSVCSDVLRGTAVIT